MIKKSKKNWYLHITTAPTEKKTVALEFDEDDAEPESLITISL